MVHQAAIRAEGLRKSLGSRRILRGIDLTINVGECVTLRGDNGTGKTTLLRCLAGLARPDAGNVHWFGRSPKETASHLLVGMVAHESHLHPHLTLRENLVLAGRLQEIAGPVSRAGRWLEAAGLRDHADRLPKEVSQGMKRRTAIARALLHDPSILLLDEPFSGLDQAGRAWLVDLLQEGHEEGRTTCLVTHEAPSERQVSDRVLELRSGRLWEPARSWLNREDAVSLSTNVRRGAGHEEFTA